MAIFIKSAEEIALMRRGGQIVAEVLGLLARTIRPGMTTRELDLLAEEEIRRRGGLPAFKGYRGFPATLCVSINEEVVHGIPGDRVVKEGDVVGLDLGAIYQGYLADSAVTVIVGGAPEEVRRLVETTREALMVGIQQARAGARVGDISAAIQEYVEARGFAVVREYVGHGIGRALHEEPQVPNYGFPGRGPLLRPGMALAIEPMVNMGDWRTRVKDDHWTVVTADGSLSAHFEHTIVVTEGEPEVLTMVPAPALRRAKGG
jgi:methionyl aminopeptidase